MKTYVCKRLRLFNYLTTNGFIPFRQCADFKDNTKYVWLFADSPELQESITQYYSQPHFKQ